MSGQSAGLSRRRFTIVGGSVLFTLGAAPLVLGRTASGQSTRVRRAIHRLVRPDGSHDPDLARYVAALKALQENHRLLWEQLRNFHDQFCSGAGAREVHFNWAFVPWHRAYLVTYERILREVSKQDSVAIPYWDWFASNAFPPVFRTGPLNHTARRIPGRPINNADRGLGPAGERSNYQVFAAFGRGNFLGTPQSFFGADAPGGNRRSAGLPESGGHSGMHNYVGGDMADLNRAARDPCFYSHHANVDRMMELWKRNIRGSNSSWRAESGPWLNTTFTFRFDNKRVYAYRVRDLLDTETVADADGVRLAYTYDNIGAPGAVASSVPAPSVLSLDGAVVQAGGLSFEPPKQIISLGPLRVTPETSRTSAVTLSTPAQGALKEFLNRDRSKELQNFTADTAAGGGARIGASVVLRLEKIQIPPHNFQINFFLNEKNPSISDIDTSNNYIASFNHVPSHANTIELDVLEVDVSERLRDRIAELGSVQISTVTEYLPPGSAPVVIGNISFVIR